MIEWRRCAVLVTRRLGELLAEALPPGPLTVLDVGCGDGRVGNLLSAARPEISLHGIEVTGREDACAPVHTSDGVCLPFGAEQSVRGHRGTCAFHAKARSPLWQDYSRNRARRRRRVLCYRSGTAGVCFRDVGAYGIRRSPDRAQIAPGDSRRHSDGHRIAGHDVEFSAQSDGHGTTLTPAASSPVRAPDPTNRAVARDEGAITLRRPAVVASGSVGDRPQRSGPSASHSHWQRPASAAPLVAPAGTHQVPTRAGLTDTDFPVCNIWKGLRVLPLSKQLSRRGMK